MKACLIPILFLMGASTLSAADPSDLIRLYEDEILAHDLYVALGRIHSDIMPLQNIPSSESRHREAMATILKAEGIALPEPAAGRRFVSPGLDETFDKWLQEGRRSEADACRVGVRLEDNDIAALRRALKDFPQHKDVLTQLEVASGNHFRAFHRNLEARGGGYTAEALTEAEVRAILSQNGQGCGAGGCGKGNGCGKNGGGSPKQPNARRHGWHGGR